MVESGRGKVSIEIVPWLTQPFGQKGSSHIILEEEVDRELTLVDFLTSLASKHPAVGEVIIDLNTGHLFDHINIVVNDVMVGNISTKEQQIKGGDSLIFLPSFVGG